MKIVCYGDSNTYGWDPRFYSSGRYDQPWPSLLAKAVGCDVVNLGEPGRVVPYRQEYLEWFGREVQSYHPDILVIMLGTNDILTIMEPSSIDAARNMEDMVAYAIRNNLAERILLLSCSQLSAEYSTFAPKLADLSLKYREIAVKYSIDFADPFTWDIPLSYDGVHFSEDGHRIFAGKMEAVIRQMISDNPAI